MDGVRSHLSLISFFTFRKSLYEKIRGGAVGFRENLVRQHRQYQKQISRPVLKHGSSIAVPNGPHVISATKRSAPDRKARVVKADGLTLHVEAE